MFTSLLLSCFLTLTLTLTLAFAAPSQPTVAAAQSVSAPDGWQQLEVEGRAPLSYRLLMPDGYEAGRSYPVLIALPPGGQNEAMVDVALQLYFETEARARGWIVASPAAPVGESLHARGAEWLAPFFDELERTLVIEGGRFHLAGVSNGGRSAFHIAAHDPPRFASLSVLPGMPGSDEDRAGLVDLAHLPISMFVGALDEGWLDGARATEQRLAELGAHDVRLTVLDGQGHQIDTAIAPELFDRLDEARQFAREQAQLRANVARVLDTLHEAASTADEARYFDQFAPGAVFVGTDSSERWTMKEFRAFALPHFEGDSAWTYRAVERHIELSRDGTLAWFDERLTNDAYGETRGSGVPTHFGGRWRIAHYVLSFAIPNDVAKEVVEVVSGATR